MPANSTSVLEPFPSTHWTLVGHAGKSSGESKREALGALLTRYMGPLRSHLVERQCLPSDRADDYLQGFFVSQVMERDLIGKAEQEKGRFRSFLLIALDRYVFNRLRQE